jgi:hypothetical protein
MLTKASKPGSRLPFCGKGRFWQIVLQKSVTERSSFPSEK